MAPWAFGLVLAGLAHVPGAAEPRANETPIEFSIPVQPLGSAITRYGDLTGSEALYDASLAAGRYSNNVDGLLTPSEALERLLAGTGLSARFVSMGKFVVVPSSPPPGSARTAPQPPAHRRYYALIQQGLLDGLCRLDGARPGRYRIIVAFRIGPDGAITDERRVGTAGTVEADQLIDATLRGIVFSEPPPPGFAQPVRILLAPELPGGRAACAAPDMRLRGGGAAR